MTVEKGHPRAILPVIQVVSGEKVEILEAGLFLTRHPYPSKPGIYQLRPVGRVWSASAESGSYVPVYGWARGILALEEMPSLHKLPDMGVEHPSR